MDMSLSELQETMKDREAWHAVIHGSQRVGHNLVAEQKQNIMTKVSLIVFLFLNYFSIFF